MESIDTSVDTMTRLLEQLVAAANNEQMDDKAIGDLMKNMDQTEQVLDVMESRADELINKISHLLDEIKEPDQTVEEESAVQDQNRNQ